MRHPLRSTTSIFAGAILILAAGTVFAGRGPGQCAPGDGPRGARGLRGAGPMLARLAEDSELQQRIGLGEDQIARLRALADEARASTSGLREGLRRARREIRDLLADAKASRSAIESKQQELEKSLQALRRERSRLMLDARDLLTVDQRERIRSELRARGLGQGRGSRGGAHRQRGCVCDPQDCPFAADSHADLGTVAEDGD